MKKSNFLRYLWYRLENSTLRTLILTVLAVILSQSVISDSIRYAIRYDDIESIKYVDRVVAQESMDKLNAIKNLNADAVFVGSDWQGTKKWIEYEQAFAEIGCSVVYLEHTDGISSSILRDKLNKRQGELNEKT